MSHTGDEPELVRLANELHEHAATIGGTAARLTQLVLAIRIATSDAVESGREGDWEHVNEIGDQLATLGQAIKTLATSTPATLDAEWDALTVDRWQGDA